MNSLNSLFFLGRQPALGLAELESVFGKDSIAPLGDGIAACSLEADEIDFSRLGGSMKLANVLGTIDTTDWKTIEKHLLKDVSAFAPSGEGKLHVGLSVYGLGVHLKDLQATALRLKKVLRSDTGRSIRIVPNQEQALSSAQVLHNHLADENGIELLLVRHGTTTILAITAAEQDINAYARRDQKRPKRDARVGMLPPKLAQIIVNLAATPDTRTILDPFCGTGVLLQEAALMGYGLYGSDLEPRMIDYTKANLEWLNETHKLQPIEVTLQTGDATVHTWDESFDTVACEGYLGQPFTGFPTNEKLNSVTHTCNLIMKGFLKNIAEQIPSGTRLAIALPAWRRKSGEFVHLKLLDDLGELGYNRVSFAHVRTEDLLYYRDDQVVARELLVITRK